MILYIHKALTQVLLSPVNRRVDHHYIPAALAITHNQCLFRREERAQITNALFKLPQRKWLFRINAVGGCLFISWEHSYYTLKGVRKQPGMDHVIFVIWGLPVLDGWASWNRLVVWQRWFCNTMVEKPGKPITTAIPGAYLRLNFDLWPTCVVVPLAWFPEALSYSEEQFGWRIKEVIICMKTLVCFCACGCTVHEPMIGVCFGGTLLKTVHSLPWQCVRFILL